MVQTLTREERVLFSLLCEDLCVGCVTHLQHISSQSLVECKFRMDKSMTCKGIGYESMEYPTCACEFVQNK